MCSVSLCCKRTEREPSWSFKLWEYCHKYTQLDTQGITDQYPALFTGLGTFKVSYPIKMKADAQPYSLFTPRNVPLPLRKKVEDELI